MEKFELTDVQIKNYSSSSSSSSLKDKTTFFCSFFGFLITGESVSFDSFDDGFVFRKIIGFERSAGAFASSAKKKFFHILVFIVIKINIDNSFRKTIILCKE